MWQGKAKTFFRVFSATFFTLIWLLSSFDAWAQQAQNAWPPLSALRPAPSAQASNDPNVVRATFESPTDAGVMHRTSPTAPANQPGAKPAPSLKTRFLPDGLDRVWTTGGALAIVLGVFFVIAWMLRRSLPKSMRALPSEAVEVLGRAPLTARQHVHLIRCGGKLLLLSVTPDSAKTLTEITDPGEVERLVGLCRPGSARPASDFRQVFDQYSAAPADAYSDLDEYASTFHARRAMAREGRDG